jgi:kynurenine formamidase
VLEGLVNLKEISTQQCTLIALPLKFAGADGSPVRAIAIEGDLL